MGSQWDSTIGQRAHALVAAFAESGVAPEPVQIWVATSAMFRAEPMSQNSAARQRCSGAVGVYFACFFDRRWTFLGSEQSLEGGRVDLVWETADGRIVVDELKMAGHADMVEDPATVAQVEKYVAGGVAMFGDRFAGVRLLPLAAPGRALWCAPGQPRQPLR